MNTLMINIAFPPKTICTDCICVFSFVFFSVFPLPPLPKQAQGLLNIKLFVYNFISVFCNFKMGKKVEEREGERPDHLHHLEGS